VFNFFDERHKVEQHLNELYRFTAQFIQVAEQGRPAQLSGPFLLLIQMPREVVLNNVREVKACIPFIVAMLGADLVQLLNGGLTL
jgi:hypothetical protein